MKKNRLLVLAAVLSLSLSACAGNAATKETTATGQAEANETTAAVGTTTVNEKAAEKSELAFRDALDREVTVTKSERVVTLLGSFCEEWLLAGGEVVGTASDTFKNYDFDFSDTVEDIGSHMEPDVEKIIALEPDLVIASSMMDAQVELKETLEKAGITVAYFYVNSFDDYLASLKVFTDITGRADLYEKNGTKVAEEIDAAKAQIDGRKPTVLFIRAAASSVKVKGSEGTVGGEILLDLDTVNIADSESLLEELSMEAIILADPDYIFVTTQGSDTEAALANVDELLVSNPAWSTLTAVKKGNYYVIDKALYNSKPNARWGEAYQKLADIIYPKEK